MENNLKDLASIIGAITVIIWVIVMTCQSMEMNRRINGLDERVRDLKNWIKREKKRKREL